MIVHWHILSPCHHKVTEEGDCSRGDGAVSSSITILFRVHPHFVCWECRNKSPKKARRNNGLTIIVLISFIMTMPSDDFKVARAGMTVLENMKIIPADIALRITEVVMTASGTLSIHHLFRKLPLFTGEEGRRLSALPYCDCILKLVLVCYQSWTNTTYYTWSM